MAGLSWRASLISVVALGLLCGALTACDAGADEDQERVVDAAVDAAPAVDMAPPPMDAAPPRDAAPAVDMAAPITGQPAGSACNCDSECGPLDGHDGVCVFGICMHTPSSDCSGGEREGCPAGSQCWSFESGAGPFCWPDCDAIEACVGVCDDDGSCAPGEDAECDSACSAYCGGGVSQGNIGAPCEDDGDCGGVTCYLAEGWVDGYCLDFDCGDAGAACGEGGVCVSGLADDNVCMDACEGGDDCRPGYTCSANAEGDICYPGCRDDAPCPDGFTCNADEVCVFDFTCSETRPVEGECPAGQVCIDGACVPFECTPNGVLEANDTRATAAEVEGPVEGVQICAADHDWYRFTPSSAQRLYTVGHRSQYGSGNLDVTLHDAGGDELDQAWLLPEGFHDENPRGPMGLEVMSLVGHPDAEAFSLHVFGVGEARNDYTLHHEETPYTDGSECVEAERKCRAMTAGGELDTSQLMMFPTGHANDPYIGDGVFFDSALSGNNTPGYVPSSARWARRELVMAIRHAIHTVQETYPGTGPLGIGEISMIDGTTPNGHPNHTHDFGGSVDLAYYIREEAQREWGNIVYRPICSDQAQLSDWSHVDTDGSTGNYGECIPGSEDTHIVDIPRTALLFAAICETGRVRVFGVDTAIDDHLAAEYTRLRDAGTISDRAFTACMGAQASADDHGSWVWHFNHSHVSFCYGDCPDAKATLDQRLRPQYDWGRRVSRPAGPARAFTSAAMPREVDPR